MRTPTKLTRRLSVALVVALVAAGGGWWYVSRAAGTRLTALFSQGVGVFPGGDVRVLGVPVGTIDTVTPEGEQVRVEMTVDADVDVPADAGAVVVPPSLVADRYVQLTPVYQGGPKIADGAVIPKARTVTPVEVDQLYRSLDQVSTALGPQGANANGSLNQLLDVGARNLAGNGAAINDTITKLAGLTATLSGNRGDLFSTVDNLRQFTETLATSDGQLRDLNGQLTDVSAFLAGERQDLTQALGRLATALDSVRGFIADNRGRIKSNVDKLASVTQVLVDQRGALAESLDVAPLALGNLANAYNASSGTLDIRANLNELSAPPIVTLCGLVRRGTPTHLPQAVAAACDRLAPVLDGAVPLPSAAEVMRGLQSGELPPLPLLSPVKQGGAGR
ncbi:MCE family protein [Amycolatopsis acidiphila]|uniref:MCE family protein n=1 Tax=Amycolatopsis acidiphila TaxID=715473 RepID=A0A558AL98_9PSEU|nr:MCE family protein [Amycolatopsis acidiphila]TVT24981.1 MCE family protein [Amycolatopsis acidiphila]UIJ57513.1 MCE family protein [Amycolatopsis acidiphila]GHG96512.1 ABC transporter substrate-binding protein [Amycolatopsis acidiphila]